MALKIFSPASDGKLLFFLGQKPVFPRVGAVVCAVKDHGVTPSKTLRKIVLKAWRWPQALTLAPSMKAGPGSGRS